ncbi:hypothetical protein VRZ08_05435 [Rhodopseudomonas sp. G2_2311]|uniref:hypothetical protein n=1 Tax=Rhodopseudomonas sp. G2_2311 TaxID=3114287 RepID=UPI0039C5E889
MRLDRSNISDGVRLAGADTARASEALIATCGWLFAAGYDTRDMSLLLFVPEANCCAALQAARARSRSRAANGGSSAMYRSQAAALMGDPPIGRSALDALERTSSSEEVA